VRIAIYPGTFDPITNGHIDIIERAVTLFDKIIVTVATNSSKQPMFSGEERVALIRKAVARFPQVETTSSDGLIVEFAQKCGAVALIRGLRAVSDFEYEFQMALMNRKLAPSVSTVFLMPNEKYSFLNSTIIRELAAYGADFSEFVPECVLEAFKTRMNA
jgi:pantetheine-phosphate adenylyltransferase